MRQVVANAGTQRSTLDAAAREALDRSGFPASSGNMDKARMLVAAGWQVTPELMLLDVEKLRHIRDKLGLNPRAPGAERAVAFFPNLNTFVKPDSRAEVKKEMLEELLVMAYVAPERTSEILDRLAGMDFYRWDVAAALATDEGKRFLFALNIALVVGDGVDVSKKQIAGEKLDALLINGPEEVRAIVDYLASTEVCMGLVVEFRRSEYGERFFRSLES